MSRHLKNIIMDYLKSECATFVSLPPNATPHTRGVRYFRTVDGIEIIRGALDQVKIGSKRRKRIIVRPSRFRKGLHELYTYHFPKTWSKACVENRELIKIAQRRAHALEHDHSYVGIEWRIRFFKHYYRVFKGGAAPEPGMKPYSRFYQYTYVAIYRELKQLQAEANKPRQIEPTSSDVTFEPIDTLSYFRAHRPAPAMTYVLTKKRCEAVWERGARVRGSTSFEEQHTSFSKIFA